MTAQIFWGSLVLGVCAFIHISMIVAGAKSFSRYFSKLSKPNFLRGIVIPLSATFALLVFAHTISVWLWAGVLIWLGALSVAQDAIYFSLVTYTTVGYGDVTLSNDFKIFGAMASVSGLLNFAVSTAYLLTVLSKLLPEHIRND